MAQGVSKKSRNSANMILNMLKLLIASLLILSAACDTLGIESLSIHLGSELDVGRDLMKGCSSIVHEAAALCNGRKPYTLYAKPSSACASYFWCAPARGACVLSCPPGKVFNTACNCCQESTPSHPIDLSTCSSSSSSSGTNTQRRKLLSTESSSAVPPSTQTIQQTSTPAAAAAAAAAAGSTQDDSTIVYNAATRTATNGQGQQVQLPEEQQVPVPNFGVWGQWGKQYTKGPFAGQAIVKEPAFGGPRHSTHLPTTASSSSSSSKINTEIGSRPLNVVAVSKPPVYAEDDSAPPAKATQRALLAEQHSTAQHAGRELAMKRLPPKSSVTTAATAGSVTTAAVSTPAAATTAAAAAKRAHVRPAAAAAGAPPSAAKKLSPDDVDVPFVSVAGFAYDKSSTSSSSKGNPSRAIRAAASSSDSSSSSSSSDAGSDIIDMGKLTGPEAESAQKDFEKVGPPVHVKPTIVPLPEYMRGKEGPYHYEGYSSKYSSPRGYKPHGHGSHHESRKGYSGYSSTHYKYKGPKKSTKGYHGSHYESRKYGPHDDDSHYESRKWLHSRFYEEPEQQQ